ncbi:MAG TPA: hypothetical protein VHC48_23565 [Puia sp.]|jgi:hypothetical protein|nr:hypothetical protein [Puia sp.]
MLKGLHWKKYLKYGIIAAILFCIPVFFFLKDITWSQSWLLYLGNALFMVVVAVTLVLFNRQQKSSASSTSLVLAGVIVTVLGIIISCLICILLLSIMIPGLYHSGTPGKVLTGEPVNAVPDRSRGPVYMVLFNATMGNICTGLFICIIFPFTLKSDQTKEKTQQGQSEV